MSAARAAVVRVGLGLLLPACGYQSAYAPGVVGEPLHVHLARAPIADALAADEVLSGVRAGLAREGALVGGDGFPRLDVEVLRLDEASAGVAAVAGAPLARGTEVGLVARAWVLSAPGAPRARDTGDLEASALLASTASPSGSTSDLASTRELFLHEEGVRAAAYRLGERLARRIVGVPTVTADRVH